MFNVSDFHRHFRHEVDGRVRDDHVGFDADADALLGDVDAGFAAEHVAGLEHPVALAHVMDVQSDEVAGIVHIVLLETGHRGILIGDILLCI